MSGWGSADCVTTVSIGILALFGCLCSVNGEGITHGLLSNDAGVGGHLHGSLLLGLLRGRHFDGLRDCFFV